MASGEGWECGKLGEVDLKEAAKTFDASSGVNEIKLHYHQEMMTVATKEGIIFFVDLTPLLRQNRRYGLYRILIKPWSFIKWTYAILSANLVGILSATAKLQGAVVVAGVRKGCFVVVSISPSMSTVGHSQSY